MDCDHIKERLGEYISGKLHRQLAELVEDHVSSCKTCRAQLEDEKKLWEVLGGWESVTPSPGHVARFWNKLPFAPKSTWQEEVSRSWVYRLAPVLAGLIIAHLCIYNYYSVQKTRTFLMSMDEQEWAMIEDYEVLANLDLLENLDELESMKS